MALRSGPFKDGSTLPTSERVHERVLPLVVSLRERLRPGSCRVFNIVSVSFEFRFRARVLSWVEICGALLTPRTANARS